MVRIAPSAIEDSTQHVADISSCPGDRLQPRYSQPQSCHLKHLVSSFPSTFISFFLQFRAKPGVLGSERGIKYLSNDLEDRINHLIEALKQTEYDIVALQEVSEHYKRFDFGVVAYPCAFRCPYRNRTCTISQP